MDSLATWLASITWPLVSRALVSIGFGYVTYTGADTALGSALDSAKGAFAGLGSIVVNLISLAGFFDFMAITSGGLVSGLAWMTMKHLALRATGP